MAHSREGALPPADFSLHSIPFSSTGELKDYLTNLLEAKEKQLQQAGALGQRVLAQQAELEERVRQLGFDTIDDDIEVDRDAYDRYRDIADAIVRWDDENAQLSSGFASSKRSPNGRLPSPSLQFTDLPREESERPKHAASSSAAQSRRAKNAAHRADDVEFAFEIGSGLLTEVRRLQSLLGERDKVIQDMKEEKDDLEKMIDNLQKALRQQEQAAEGYKDANWNLEYQLQEHAAQLTERTASIQRLESENKRVINELAQSRTYGEQQKADIERLRADIAAMKAKHETDIAQARKHAAGLARDKSDLQQTIDNLKAEAQRKRLPRFGAPTTPNGPDADEFSTPAGEKDETFTPGASTRRRLDSTPLYPADEFEFPDSPENSPSRPTFLAANHPSNEIEALQQRLAHAQRQINTLKGTLQREKQLKLEYRNKLESLSPGGVVDEDDNEEFVDEEVVEPKSPPKRVTPQHKPTRGRGRGRGGRVGMSLIERLGMVAHSPASDWDDDHQPRDTSPPPAPPIPSRFSRAEEDEGDALFGSSNSLQTISERREYVRERTPERETEHELPRSPSPTPLEPPSNRTSVEGMDPKFANILRRVPSNGSAYAGSPLRHLLGKAVRGGGMAGRRQRGGVPYKEPRPASVVDAPDVLAAELGANSSPMKDLGIPEENELIKQFIDVETAEFGCQTEPEEVPPPAPVPEPELVVQPEPAPVKVTADIGIQSDPEPMPAPEPRPILVEISMQTDEEPVIDMPKADVGIQHEEKLEPVVVIPKADIGIQHEEEAVEVPPPPPAPVRVDSGVSTDPETVPIAPVMVQTEVQTMPEVLEEVRTPMQLPRQRLPSTISDFGASRRATITQHDAQNRSWSADSSSAADTTITGATGRSFLEPAQTDDEEDEDDAGNETETGVETETDMDDYHDARQSILMTTPSASESREDFHSVYTVTDIEGAGSDRDDDDDNESIKASMVGSMANPSTASFDGRASSHSYYSSSRPRHSPSPSPSPPPPPVTYKSASVSADFLPEPERITVTVEVPVPVVPPKPEVKEISIQTDEWKPPAPPAPPPVPTPAPASPAVPAPQGFGLYRVGSNLQHQFQYVAPPSASATASTASLTPAATQLPAAIITTNAAVPRSGTSTPASPAIVGTIPMPVPIMAQGPRLLRESSQVFGRPRTSASDRRVSVESAMSSVADDLPRSRVPSSVAAAPAVDKTKPPMMALPPPPRAPPPPSAMPPPSFIPERRIPTTSTTSYDGPPPRPSSPPPAELIQRATTPLGSVLGIPGISSRGNSIRLHGSTLPPPHAAVSQRPSTGSFRSAQAPSYTPQSLAASGVATFTIRDKERREFSSTSLAPSERSVASPRSSVSSDHAFGHNRDATEPMTPEKSADITPRAHDLSNVGHSSAVSTGTATDPGVIHSITQTMIGEFLYKYTRKAIGKGHGERRHKRFFWVHPYTKTLYWSSADPGSSNVSESSAKSAYIEGVRSVLDPNPMPPGLYQYSVVVSTPQREMKITAPTKERHDIWLNALKYLLSRPNPGSVQSPPNLHPMSPTSPDYTDDDRRQVIGTSPQSQRSTRSTRPGEPWNSTPRQRRSRSQLSVGGSISKRSGTPALEYLRYNHTPMDAPYSPSKSFVDDPVQDHEELDFELHDENMSDDGYEGLENVRACCDGRHTVGHSGGRHHHHHHHHHHHEPAQVQHEYLEAEPAARPVSPAWSFRSRAGSSHSHETSGGVGGIFSWGRGEDGKLRFGSRRIKTVPNHDA